MGQKKRKQRRCANERRISREDVKAATVTVPSIKIGPFSVCATWFLSTYNPTTTTTWDNKSNR